MNYYRFPNNRIFRISVFLFLFLLQMLTRSTAYANVFLDFAQSQFLMLGLILAFALVFGIIGFAQIAKDFAIHSQRYNTFFADSISPFLINAQGADFSI